LLKFTLLFTGNGKVKEPAGKLCVGVGLKFGTTLFKGVSEGTASVW
jgi:hypothetical protein